MLQLAIPLLSPVDAASVCDICQDGISQPPTFTSNHGSPQDTPTSPAIWLTNSVNIADHLRLAQQGQSKLGQGKLMLCKVFIGQAVETYNSGL